MQRTETRTIVTRYEDFGDWLARKWRDGELEPDDYHRDPETGEGFAQFGRRVIVDEGDWGGVDYERFPTVTAACERMGELHNRRGPVADWDAIIAEDRGRYTVSVEGVRVGTYDDRDDATLALACWMIDAGCFPDSFYVNDRGNWHRIDEDVRELHDEGGDRMREDLR